MNIQQKRGTGITSRQIKDAPLNSIFICHGRPDYVRALATYLGRLDLKIIGPDFHRDRIRGVNRHVVVDHAAILSSQDKDEIAVLNYRNSQRKETNVL